MDKTQTINYFPHISYITIIIFVAIFAFTSGRSYEIKKDINIKLKQIKEDLLVIEKYQKELRRN